MAALAAMNRRRLFMVAVVTKSDVHLVVHSAWDRNREANTEDAVRNPQ